LCTASTAPKTKDETFFSFMDNHDNSRPVDPGDPGSGAVLGRTIGEEDEK
jgi:hypothetical protein